VGAGFGVAVAVGVGTCVGVGEGVGVGVQLGVGVGDVGSAVGWDEPALVPQAAITRRASARMRRRTSRVKRDDNIRDLPGMTRRWRLEAASIPRIASSSSAIECPRCHGDHTAWVLRVTTTAHSSRQVARARRPLPWAASCPGWLSLARRASISCTRLSNALTARARSAAFSAANAALRSWGVSWGSCVHATRAAPLCLNRYKSPKLGERVAPHIGTAAFPRATPPSLFTLWSRSPHWKPAHTVCLRASCWSFVAARRNQRG
jgi:hypothetical protein